MSRKRKMSVMGRNDEINLPNSNRLLFGVELKGSLRNLQKIDCCCLGYTKLGILKEYTHFCSIGDQELIDEIRASMNKLKSACASVSRIGEEKIVTEGKGRKKEEEDFSTVTKIDEKDFSAVEGKGFEMVFDPKDFVKRDIQYIFFILRTERNVQDSNVEQVVTYWQDADKDTKIALNSLNLLKPEFEQEIRTKNGLISSLLYRNDDETTWKIRALNKGLTNGTSGIGHISAELMNPDFFPDKMSVITAKLKYFNALCEQVASIPLHLTHIKHYCIFKAKMDDIPKMDMFGLSDPYFIVQNKEGEEIFRSETLYKTLNPVYHREMYIFDENFFKPNEMYTVKVYDWDKLKKDDYIGSFKISPIKIAKGTSGGGRNGKFMKYEIIDHRKLGNKEKEKKKKKKKKKEKKKKKYKNSGIFTFTFFVKKVHTVRVLNKKHSKLQSEIKDFWKR